MIYFYEKKQTDPIWEKGGQTKTARELLLFALRREYGLAALPQIEADVLGKPYFPQMPEISFNYSHCRAGILCGVSRDRIGVDAEGLRSFRPGMPPRICHPNELARVNAAPDPDAALTKLWVAKEAYLKYLGTGIRQELNLLDLSGLCFGRETSFAGIPARIWEKPGIWLCGFAQDREDLELCAVRWEELKK